MSLGIVITTILASPSLHDSFADCQDEECVEEEVFGTSLDWNGQHNSPPSTVEQQLAAQPC